MLATHYASHGDGLHTRSYQTASTTYTPHDQQMSSTGPTLNGRIVIPQRRPGSKERGFLLAYPPALEAYGISQDTFLDFIQGCNKAVQGHAALTAVGVAGFGVGLAPEPITMLVGAAVQFGAAALNKNVATWKTNSFLDRCNDELFSPRGLMCFISVHEPDEAAETASAITSFSPKGWESGPAAAYRRSSSRGNAQDVAPLIYLSNLKEPVVSDTQSTDKATMSRRVKSTYTKLNNHLDRKSWETYAKENPNDLLVSMRAPIEPQPQSRYLEYTGHYKGTRSNQEQRQGSPSNADGRNSERKIKKNILYLTIIELPSRSNHGPGASTGHSRPGPEASHNTELLHL